MTIIDELLVLQDDGTSRTLDECVSELETKTKQAISSTLGRLVGKKLISVTTVNKQKVFAITPLGREVVTNTLDHIGLTDESSWDGTWLFIIFNVPESQRKYRDMLRNRLSSSGFGRVQNSLWINARDISSQLEDILSNSKLKDYITLIKPKLEDDDIKEVSKHLDFDWKGLKKSYEQFIKKSEEFLKSTKKPLFARFLVYNYAKISSEDPKIPLAYCPASEQKKQARKLYERIREYCYE